VGPSLEILIRLPRPCLTLRSERGMTPTELWEARRTTACLPSRKAAPACSPPRPNSCSRCRSPPRKKFSLKPSWSSWAQFRVINSTTFLSPLFLPLKVTIHNSYLNLHIESLNSDQKGQNQSSQEKRLIWENNILKKGVRI
jgi:hypothetical protein